MSGWRPAIGLYLPIPVIWVGCRGLELCLRCTLTLEYAEETVVSLALMR